MRALGKILFVLYIAFLLYFLIFSDWYGRTGGMREYHYNLVLFKEIKRFWNYRDVLGWVAYANLFGNVLIFIPFGFFMPMASRYRNFFLMFGTIMTSGVEMIAKCGFTQRNITIVALSLAIGIGFTAASEEGLWNIFPSMVQDVFASNVVAVVFVVAVVLNLVLPANMDIHHEK